MVPEMEAAGRGHQNKGDTMFCSSCGKSVPENVRFCPHCGGPVEKTGSSPLPPRPPFGSSLKNPWLLVALLGLIVIALAIALPLSLHSGSGDPTSTIGSATSTTTDAASTTTADAGTTTTADPTTSSSNTTTKANPKPADPTTLTEPWVAVPQLVGLTLSNAAGKLDSLGLAYDITEETPTFAPGDANIIYDQEPGSGTVVPPGFIVDIALYRLQDVTVPNLYGLSYDTALTRLGEAHLKNGHVEWNPPDPGYSAYLYRVTWQSWYAGTTVPAGTSVDLTLTLP
jgi:hypothetical protein